MLSKVSDKTTMWFQNYVLHGVSCGMHVAAVLYPINVSHVFATSLLGCT